MEEEKQNVDENLTEESDSQAESKTETSEDESKETGKAQPETKQSQSSKDDKATDSESTDEAKDSKNIDQTSGSESTDEAAKDEGETDKKKKKSFKKKDKKDQQIEELNDKYQRLFAEFQNYRSRSEKEKNAMYEVGARAIIEKILPVVDTLERGVAALNEEDLGTPIGEGMSLTYKQMTSALEEMGVTVIETEGKEFDPELHNAVMHEDNDDFGENMISQELQKGYKYRDTVVRHSMVKVAN